MVASTIPVIAQTLPEFSGLELVVILMSAAMVLLMQAGFCLLESGMSRAKHSINVAIKNLADFCVSGLLFWMVGFGVMFGLSHGGWIGTTHFAVSEGASTLAFLAFQLVFCGTATTIVSGAVAERMRFGAYLFVAATMAIVIYPIFGHWAWGGLLGGSKGWLAELGFIDFAGSTVVHSVGGWIALAAVMILGPRSGRFETSSTGGAKPSLAGHNFPAAATGVLVLWFGWIGFNLGSLHAVDGRLAVITLNTILGGAAGGFAAMIASFVATRRLQPGDLFGGIVAGLVSVTAGCHAYGPTAAVCIAMLAGILYVVAARLMERAKIDDVVGAVPAHVVAGVWGTLAVALFADDSALSFGMSRWTQFGVQAIGVSAAFVWAFGVGGCSLILLNRFLPLRVSEEAERLGLNIFEHGCSTDVADLIEEMRPQEEAVGLTHVHVESDSEVSEIAAAFNNVIDRVHAETVSREESIQALAAAEEEYRLMFENSVEGAYRRQPEGGILAANKAYADLLGFESVDQLIEQTIDDVAARYSGGRLPYEMNADDLDGEYRARIVVDDITREVIENVRTVRDELGAVKWVQVSVTDITETIQSVELRREVDVANAASEAKSAYLASMSHEIRTPLHGVTGMLQLIGKTDLDSDQRRLLSNAQISAEALLTQINDVLDLSKIESGKLEVHNEEFELTELVEEIATAFTTALKNDDIEVQCDIAPDIPRRVVADPRRLRQVLSNVVGNAVKFTEEGEIRLLVNRGDGDSIEFKISDTGPGIPEDELETLFDRYSQGAATSEHKGTGLGLSICRELAQLMGGSIHAESGFERGATFLLTLPMKAVATMSQTPTIDRLNERSLRILIVDDRQSNIDSLQRMLTGWDHRCVGLDDPTKVERCLEDAANANDPIELIVVDHKMPLRDGIEVAATLRSDERWSELPIILVSSDRLGVPQEEAELVGLTSVLPKPVRQSAMFNALLMISEDDAVSMPSASEAAASTKRLNNSTGPRVLIAEDNGINQCFATHILNEAGYRTAIASTGVEAIQQFEMAHENDEPFAVVLMDCQMPEMDGLEASQAIRDIETKRSLMRTPIVALTADAVAGDREKCLNAGMDDYLTKPIDAAELVERTDAFAIGERIERFDQSDNAVEVLSDVQLVEAVVELSTNSAEPASADRDDDESVALLDIEELRSRCLGDDEFVEAVLRQFTDELPVESEKVRLSAENENREAVLAAAHTIKGFAGNVTALAIYESASATVQSLQGEHVDDADWKSHVDQLVNRVESTLNAVEEFLGEAKLS